MAAITDAQIARIKDRARDPDRRNDTPPTARGRTVAVGNFAIAGVSLASLLSGNPEPPRDPEPSLAAPANPQAIADAEARLGFPLPADLRRLYGEIGDGGFGPGAGLLPLNQVTETYLALTATPPGRRGQRWPATLLPFTWSNPGYDCIDIETNKIVFWDEEELADGASDKVWNRSFKAEAPDLATWFDRWLGTLSPEQRMQAQMQNAMLNTIRDQLKIWRAKTHAERAKAGLPETGWEQVLFGHLGIDLSKL
jgi:hypothetical protein